MSTCSAFSPMYFPSSSPWPSSWVSRILWKAQSGRSVYVPTAGVCLYPRQECVCTRARVHRTRPEGGTAEGGRRMESK
eukprot:6186660-Pleurochrysis_carterae.AAC.3